MTFTCWTWQKWPLNLASKHFLELGVSLVVILTHLEICTGFLDNRFKKPLALSFQNTPWKTNLKINFLRNFRLKKNFFFILGSVPNFKKMFGSQVQMPFSPSSPSERQGQKLWAVPQGIYQVIQKVLSNFHNKMTKKKNLP